MIFTRMVETFANFPPLGLVLVVMLGIGTLISMMCAMLKRPCILKNSIEIEIADPYCTHWQAPRADAQTKACQRVQFFYLRHVENFLNTFLSN